MSFSREVQIALDKMEGDVETFVRAVNFKAFTAIIRETPVDTGRLRGNWQTSETTPIGSRIDRIQTGSSGPATADAELVLERGLGLFWLSNNLPYAEVAEYGKWGTGPYKTEKTTADGYSVQAPEGMVRRTAARLRSIIQESK